MKQKELSVVLRLLLIPCAAVAAFMFYVLLKEMGSCYYSENPLGLVSDLVVLLAFLPALAFLADTWQIFRDIGRDKSFTLKNARRLRRISFYAMIDTALVILFGILWACMDEFFGGILLVCGFFIFVGVAVAAACSVLSHLTRKAADIQDENSLTI